MSTPIYLAPPEGMSTEAIQAAVAEALGVPTNVQLVNGANTLANPTGTFADGKTLKWRMKQPTSGAAGTVTLGNKFRIPASATTPLPFSTVNSKVDILAAMYNEADDKWDIVTFIPQAY
jgi:hypothetical protein